MSGGEYAALAYVVVLVTVVAYVAIIAAKLQRLQRETGELVALARRRGTSDSARPVTYAAPVPGANAGEEDES